MREIKFRAWDKHSNRIVAWHDLMNEEEKGDLAVVLTDRLEIDFVVMQYTGLHDKNGKEIYEGDIIEYDADSQGRPFIGDGYRFEVGFSCGSFILVDPQERYGERGGFSSIYLHTPCLTVIGNIYENPELLHD